MKTISILGGLAALAMSSAALAAVTFDAETGTGFVGKGDVQLAFGWNNKAAQDNANAVSFTFETETAYIATCEWDTVAGKSGNVIHHEVNLRRNTALNSNINSDPRKTGQYTGYNLSGFGATTTSGQSVPTVGGACPGNNPGIVTEVQELGNTGGLFVHFNGMSAQL